METRFVLRAAACVLLVGVTAARAQVLGGNEPKEGTTAQDGYTVIDLAHPISGVDAYNDRVRAFQVYSSTGCDVMLKIYRKPFWNTSIYQLIGTSDVYAVLAGSMQTFPADIPVANGDLVGFTTVEHGLGGIDYTVDTDTSKADSLVYRYDVGTVLISAGNPLPHLRSIRVLGVASAEVRTDYTFTTIVPVATRAPGTNGTLFRTEGELYNPSSADSTASFLFVQAGKDGTGTDIPDPKVVVIKAGETKHIADLVKDVFGLDGVTGLVRISATNRITSRWRIVNETENGNFGQDIPAVLPNEGLQYDPQALVTAGRGFDLIGAEETDAKRTNLGLVNFSSGGELEVNVEPFDNTGKSMATAKTFKVPKLSMIQLNRVLTQEFGFAHGTSGVRLRVEPNDKSGKARLFPYLSIIDNVSEDPIFVRGAKPPSL